MNIEYTIVKGSNWTAQVDLITDEDMTGISIHLGKKEDLEKLSEKELSELVYKLIAKDLVLYSCVLQANVLFQEKNK